MKVLVRGLLALGLLAVVAVTGNTQAAFTDTAKASASVSAAALSPVTSLTCRNIKVNGNDAVELTWSEVERAEHYRVYHKGSSTWGVVVDDERIYSDTSVVVTYNDFPNTLLAVPVPVTTLTITARAEIGPEGKPTWVSAVGNVSTRVSAAHGSVTKYVRCA